MSEQEIYERLNEVFRNVFDDDEIEVEAGTTADDIEDWDSLEHINLISAVEDEFGIRFKMGEVSSYALQPVQRRLYRVRPLFLS